MKFPVLCETQGCLEGQTPSRVEVIAGICVVSLVKVLCFISPQFITVQMPS